MDNYPTSKIMDETSEDTSENKKLKKGRHKKKEKKKISKERFEKDVKRKKGQRADSGDEYEWAPKLVEPKSKPKESNSERETWMTEQFNFKTYTKTTPDDKVSQCQESYHPTTNSKELNPYWKNRGVGCPIFQKPKDDENIDNGRLSDGKKYASLRHWRKDLHSENYVKFEEVNLKKCSDKSSCMGRETIKINLKESESELLTDQEMNDLGAKILKAEIMGNTELAKELSEKLNRARGNVKASRGKPNLGQVPKLTNILPNKKMLSLNSSRLEGDTSSRKRSNKTTTVVSGVEPRYNCSDTRFDIKQMFEREKFTSAHEQDLQYAEMAANHSKHKKYDSGDYFMAAKKKSKCENEEKHKIEPILEYKQLTKTLDKCRQCLDSKQIDKGLIVSLGKSVYLSLPWYEGLQPGHCLIIPIQHVSCSTQTDEDTWEEIENFKRALTTMFRSRSQDVIFFETATYLSKKPHLVVHCIPSSGFAMAQFYFKKAIEESEAMWSINKQIMILKEKDIKKTIPKGLPYFWVHFGMELGFAHVIEDQEKFPPNFAQEIIAGILQLNPNSWRHPRKECNVTAKVKQFANWWKEYDCTKT